jgi:hypothetical protein
MKSFNLTKLGFVIVLLTIFLAAPIQAASEVFVHFIVVPSETRGGRDIDRALDDLKQHFAELAGGYTFLGVTDGAYLPPGGKLEKNKNYTFMVAAPQNLTRDIEAYIPKYFDTPKPYVLVWKAASNY